MILFDAYISPDVSCLLNKILSGIKHFNEANNAILKAIGITSFFAQQDEYELFMEAANTGEILVSEPDRAEYGDFQTNINLAKAVTQFLKKQHVNPKYILEPTCGKGHFILAALATFDNIQKITAVEIYKPYTWETKFSIIDFYIKNPKIKKPEIEIFHYNVFDYELNKLANVFGNDILILGNPPWVTNSKLSALDSNNLPQKSNFKNYNGFDAITGKGNFDIGEYITLMMFEAFQHRTGHFAFLVKNVVIKNVVYDQFRQKYKIAGINKFTIDSKKEFNVSVEASLLFCTFNSNPEFTCKEFDFYHPSTAIREFGWVDDKFVSNTLLYQDCKDIDGVCPLVWRQGIKHDLSAIMELEKLNNSYVNGKGENVIIEDDLVYGVLKSSDLKPVVVSSSRKHTIITQKKVGQDTSYIKTKYPLTYKYLLTNKPYFDQRKSSIYNNKPPFSIFGIGDYSFAKYKIAISGLYKTFSFSLVLPMNNKPLMLDDTCYLLGFEKAEYAAFTFVLLNSERVKTFLRAITFSDAKRTFTKDVLMRIDLYKLAVKYSEPEITEELKQISSHFNFDISHDSWDNYLKILNPHSVCKQMDLFASVLPTYKSKNSPHQ